MSNNIEDRLIELAIREVRVQCRFAEVSYLNICEKEDKSTDLVFTSIHSFLSHCGNVSKLLWPGGLARNLGSQKIAQILDLPEKSIIRDRSFRDSLEHYDERLAGWIKEKGPNINILDFNVGLKHSLNISDSIWVRHFDPTQKIFTLLDEDLNLEEMYKEIMEIKGKVDYWVGNLESKKSESKGTRQ
ncbi:MAG: hypothetical protein O2807_07565 [bacterium]|nr:hypothetical protein [bacterium]